MNPEPSSGEELAEDSAADGPTASGEGGVDSQSQTDQEIGYSDAIIELDRILQELDQDDTDIDALSDRVERAATLISICRGRIHHAQARVDQIVAGLDDGAGARDQQP